MTGAATDFEEGHGTSRESPSGHRGVRDYWLLVPVVGVMSAGGG